MKLAEVNNTVNEKDLQIDKLKRQCEEQAKLIINYKEGISKNIQLEVKHKELEKAMADLKLKEAALNEKVKEMDIQLKYAAIREQEAQKTQEEAKSQLLQMASSIASKDAQIAQEKLETARIAKSKSEEDKRYDYLKNTKIDEYSKVASKCA